MTECIIHVSFDFVSWNVREIGDLEFYSFITIITYMIISMLLLITKISLGIKI